MPKLTGLFKFEGTIGDVTAYKAKGKGNKKEILMRGKGGVSAERIATDPAFQRTRENGTEFGRAAQDAKHIRVAFSLLLTAFKNTRLVSQLTQKMREILALDATNPRGSRVVLPANIGQLNGFAFNPSANLGSVFRKEITSGFATPNVTFAVPAYTPSVDVIAPEGATHYQIKAMAAEIDFAGNVVGVVGQDVTAVTSVTSGVAVVAETLTCPLTGATVGNAVIGVLQVVFFQRMNLVDYPLNNAAYIPTQIAYTGLFA
jgi:hypothetical protein